MSNTKIILVLGMHRSGTSIAARAMRCLGASLGNNLMAGDAHNERGHFEDWGFVHLNERALRLCGLEWNISAGSNLHGIRWPEQLIDEAEGFFEDRAALCYPIFAVKDPRACRLLEFWSLPLSHYEIHFLVTIRHPEGVAKSLQSRDHIDRHTSYTLWKEHYRGILNNSYAARSICFINFEDFIDSPESHLSSIAKAFGISVIIGIEDLHKFLSKTLWHHRGPYENGFLDQDSESLYNDLVAKAIR